VINMNENIIKTQIPFDDELLDKCLNDDDGSLYVIEFDKSQYKDVRFLNYIYNLELKNFIVNFQNLSTELSDILIEYITINKILSVDIFNRIWINVLEKHLFNKHYDNEQYDAFLSEFINKNHNIIEELSIILCSLKSYLLQFTFNKNFDITKYLNNSEEFKQIGINLVSLRNSITFWNLFEELDNAKNINIKKYKNFYNNSFEGYNIDKYFLKEFNPLGLIFTMSNDNYKQLNDFTKELKCTFTSD